MGQGQVIGLQSNDPVKFGRVQEEANIKGLSMESGNAKKIP